MADSNKKFRKPKIQFKSFDDFPTVSFEEEPVVSEVLSEVAESDDEDSNDIDVIVEDTNEEDRPDIDIHPDEDDQVEDDNSSRSFTSNIFNKLQRFFEGAKPKPRDADEYAQEFTKEYMQTNALNRYNPFAAKSTKEPELDDSVESNTNEELHTDSHKEIIDEVVTEIATDDENIADAMDQDQDVKAATAAAVKASETMNSESSSDSRVENSVKEVNFAPHGEEELTPLEEILAKHAKLPLAEAELKLRPAYYFKHVETQRATNLDEVKEIAKDYLPLPREQQNIVKTNINWLMSQLYTCPNAEALDFMADSLRTEDLLGIFPALAVCKSSYDRERLTYLIKRRANKLLYFHGWLTLQATYPKSSVQRALTELCAELNKDQDSVENNLREKPEFDLGGRGVFNWINMPLITDIANPASRHFVSRLADRSEEYDDFSEFCQIYGIYEDLQLARQIKELIYQRREFDI